MIQSCSVRETLIRGNLNCHQNISFINQRKLPNRLRGRQALEPSVLQTIKKHKKQGEFVTPFSR
jgi:hypothetical protein